MVRATGDDTSSNMKLIASFHACCTGVRRSSRRREKPVDYWRNERVIYSRRRSGAGIADVVRLPKEPPRTRKKSATPAPASGSSAGGARKRIKREDSMDDRADDDDPDAGIDDLTEPDGTVWSWEADGEIQRRIAFTAKMVSPKPSTSGTIMFQKVFTELDYLAGGVLLIPAGTAKPLKASKDNSYVRLYRLLSAHLAAGLMLIETWDYAQIFYCLEGAVSVVVHRTKFAIGRCVLCILNSDLHFLHAEFCPIDAQRRHVPCSTRQHVLDHGRVEARRAPLLHSGPQNARERVRRVAA